MPYGWRSRESRPTRFLRKYYGGVRKTQRKFIRKSYAKIGMRVPLLHNFSRKTGTTTILHGTVNTGVDNYKAFAYSFDLTQLPNYTDFTSLFDVYRINQVVVTFMFQGCVNNTADTYFSAVLPRMITTTDVDDATLPTASSAGWDELCEYQTSKIRQVGNGAQSLFKYRIKPHVTTEVYKSAITTGYAPKKGVWLDCGNPDIPHFGLKGLINVPTANTGGNTFTYRWDVFSTYYLSLRNPR